MGNNDADVASLLQNNFGNADEVFKQIKSEGWKHWLEKDFWDYREAIRLIACGPCTAIVECRKDVEAKCIGVETYVCFYEKINDATEQLHKIFRLYEKEMRSSYGIPTRTSPAKFIEWAIAKDS